MKKLVILFLLGFSISSCFKDNDGGDYFECKIDNENYKIEGVFAYAVKFSAGDIAIYGLEDPTEENSRTLYVTLDQIPEEGTFDLGRDQKGHGYYTDSNSTFTYATIYEGASGTLEILDLTEERLKGEFSFTALDDSGDKIEITSGKFDVAFRE